MKVQQHNLTMSFQRAFGVMLSHCSPMIWRYLCCGQKWCFPLWQPPPPNLYRSLSKACFQWIFLQSIVLIVNFRLNYNVYQFTQCFQWASKIILLSNHLNSRSLHQVLWFAQLLSQANLPPLSWVTMWALLPDLLLTMCTNTEQPGADAILWVPRWSLLAFCQIHSRTSSRVFTC